MPRVSVKTALDSFPKQGNRELPVTLDFTNAGTLFDDLAAEMQAGQIDFVQSVYIDNSLNAASLLITFLDTGMNITAQPYSQGIYPVIAGGVPRYRATTSPGQKVEIIFSNTQRRFQTWGATPGVFIVPPLNNPAINFQPLAAGDNILVAGVANETVKLYRTLLAFGAGTNVQFFDGPSVNNKPLTGIINMFAGGSINMQPSGIPWLNATSLGNGLILNSSAAVNMGGVIGYVQS